MTILDCSGPLIGFYGDDFTGSSGVMEALEFAGLASVLFLGIPRAHQLARFEGVRAMGIASTARTRSPEWMEEHLPRAFRFLADTGAPIIHYKTCSTLDSSPSTGSIGRAIDIGARIVAGRWVPCLVASPNMRRYQCFGHLFASAPGGVFRLDRHPVMSRHPVTPMTESDVAMHLAAQTAKRTGLIDLEMLSNDPERQLENVMHQGAEVVVLDAMSMDDLATCGRLIWQERGDAQLFVVGSQGVEYALVEHWRSEGQLEPARSHSGAGSVDRIVVVSGSVSAVTAAQIDWAIANGFAGIQIDAAAIACGSREPLELAVSAARTALSEGRDPIIYSAKGPDDPAVGRMREAAKTAGIPAETANERVGTALGQAMRQLLEATGLRRGVISGGDTSGVASSALDYFALTMLAPTLPGAPLMRTWSDNPGFDGIELALKGGQMGSIDYFSWIKRGGGTA